MTHKCHVCKREVKRSGSTGALALHYVRNPAGRRVMCLGSGEQARPTVEQVKQWLRGGERGV
jgi:hypothetical protein